MKRWRHSGLTWVQVARRGCLPADEARSVQLPPVSQARLPIDQAIRRPVRRSKRRARVAAASLPAPSQGDAEVLEQRAQLLRSARRANAGSIALDPIPSMALRLQAGRTHEHLAHLMESGLLRASASQAGSSLQPAVGLTGTVLGADVIILGSFCFRGHQRWDVVPVVQRAGPSGATHFAALRSVWTCASAEISNVRYAYRAVCSKHRRTWLCVVTRLGPLGPAEHDACIETRRRFLAMGSSLHVQGQTEFQVQSPRAVAVVPLAAAEHRASFGHSVTRRTDLQVSPSGEQCDGVVSEGWGCRRWWL